MLTFIVWIAVVAWLAYELIICLSIRVSKLTPQENLSKLKRIVRNEVYLVGVLSVWLFTVFYFSYSVFGNISDIPINDYKEPITYQGTYLEQSCTKLIDIVTNEPIMLVDAKENGTVDKYLDHIEGCRIMLTAVDSPIDKLLGKYFEYCESVANHYGELDMIDIKGLELISNLFIEYSMLVFVIYGLVVFVPMTVFLAFVGFIVINIFSIQYYTKCIEAEKCSEVTHG